MFVAEQLAEAIELVAAPSSGRARSPSTPRAGDGGSSPLGARRESRPGSWNGRRRRHRVARAPVTARQALVVALQRLAFGIHASTLRRSRARSSRSRCERSSPSIACASPRRWAASCAHARRARRATTTARSNVVKTTSASRSGEIEWHLPEPVIRAARGFPDPGRAGGSARAPSSSRCGCRERARREAPAVGSAARLLQFTARNSTDLPRQRFTSVDAERHRQPT